MPIKTLMLIAAIALGGCASTRLHSVNGDPVYAPEGFIEYCAKAKVKIGCEES